MLSGKEPFTVPDFPLAFRDDPVGGDLDFLEEDWVKEIRVSKYSFDGEIWASIAAPAKT